MSEPFIGEVRIFAGNFAPQGWAFCNGQLLDIADYQALFTIIKNIYGGDGETTMALPNMQGCAVAHPSQGKVGGMTWELGQTQGSDTVTLTASEMPTHGHLLTGTTTPGGANIVPGNTTALARNGFGDKLYQTATTENLVDMAADSISSTGGGGAHNNVQPYIALNYIIALQGAYPSSG